MYRYILASTLLIASGLLAPYQRTAAAESELITVGVVDWKGENKIEQFNRTGEKTASIPISEEYQYSKFIAGNWLPNNTPSVIAITIDDKDRATAAILNSNGAVVASLSLGKALRKVIALDLDGSGLTDLAVQGNGAKATVYIDPGLNGGNSPKRKIKAPASKFIIAIPGTNRDLIGTLKVSSPAKNAGKRSKKGFVQYVDENGKKQRVRLRGAAEAVYALQTADGKAAFALVNSKSVAIAGAPTAVEKYEKYQEQEVVSGAFTDGAGSSLLFGAPKGIIYLFNPSQPEMDTSLRISLQSSDRAEAISLRVSSACISYEKLQNSFLAALSVGNLIEAMRIAQTLSVLEVQCTSGGSIGSVEEVTSIFVPGEAAYISSNTLQIGSSSGPCSKYNNAEDGLGGFLAKNSDSYRGSVYLTKYGYLNGRLLNSNTYKVIEKLEYTGVANGGRNHFRSKTPLPRPAHIFAADYYGETHCWMIPGGKTRVD